MRTGSLGLLVAIALLAAACSDGEPTEPPEPAPEEAPDEETEGEPQPSDEEPEGAEEVGSLRTDDLVTGLEAPWDVVATVDGDVLIAERDSGRLLRAEGLAAVEDTATGDAAAEPAPDDEPTDDGDGDGGDVTTDRESDDGRSEDGQEEAAGEASDDAAPEPWSVDELEEVRRLEVDAEGEGGLLGLALSPTADATWTGSPPGDGEEPGWLYLYRTTADGNEVVRLPLDDLAGAEPERVVERIPSAAIHNGGRLAFGPQGDLYIGTGDAGDGPLAQDPASLAGKILRVEPDGSVPDDAVSDSLVHSLGHRNVQGLTFDADGRLWAAELGPDADDEINLIEPGANYGWPQATGAPGAEGLTDAAFVAQPSEASWSGAQVLVDGAIEAWEGDLLVSGLRGQRLWRLDLDGERVADSETRLEREHGRLRHVTRAPDGGLWVLTSNRDGRGSPADGDDRLLLVTPAD